MNFKPKFVQNNMSFNPQFREIQTASDGGYERGYAEGLAERRHEVWIITLVDGTVVEKEVALL